MGHGQQVVAGGHARAAHDRDLPGFAPGHQALESVPQRFRREQPPFTVEVVDIGPVDRAGHVAGHRVDGLGLTAEPCTTARVQQQAAGLQVGLHAAGIQQPGLIEAAAVAGRRGRGHRDLHRQAQRLPSRPPAVEHRDPGVPERAQQEPQPRRERAIAAVAGHDLVVRGDAPGAQARAKVLHPRPRVAPATGSGRGGSRQVAIHVRVHGAGHVARCERRRPGIRIGKRVAAIDHRKVFAAQRARQCFRLHQGGPGRRHAVASLIRASRSRRLYRIEAVTPQMRCGTSSGSPRYSSTSRRRPP